MTYGGSQLETGGRKRVGWCVLEATARLASLRRWGAYRISQARASPSEPNLWSILPDAARATTVTIPNMATTRTKSRYFFILLCALAGGDAALLQIGAVPALLPKQNGEASGEQVAAAERLVVQRRPEAEPVAAPEVHAGTYEPARFGLTAKEEGEASLHERHGPLL